MGKELRRSSKRRLLGAHDHITSPSISQPMSLFPSTLCSRSIAENSPFRISSPFQDTSASSTCTLSTFVCSIFAFSASVVTSAS